MLDINNPEHAEMVRYLNYMVRTYERVTDMIVATKNCLKTTNPDVEAKHDALLQGEGRGEGLESLKNRLARKIEKELQFFPIYTEWMKHVPGMGTYTSAGLILLYYYRFVPSCKKCLTPLLKQEGTYWCETCQKSAKGDGNLTFTIQLKDFRNIGKWWAYLGMHCDDEGRKPKRKKGTQVTWSPKGRKIGYYMGDQVAKQKKGPYYDFYQERLKKREKTHPDATAFHRKNMAKNETAKLMLAHFWTVARTLDAKPVTAPYAQTIMGHTGIIDPFYFDINEKAA